MLVLVLLVGEGRGQIGSSWQGDLRQAGSVETEGERYALLSKILQRPDLPREVREELPELTWFAERWARNDYVAPPEEAHMR